MTSIIIGLHKLQNGFVGAFSIPLFYSTSHGPGPRRVFGHVEYGAEPGRREATRRRASAPVAAWLQNVVDSSTDGAELLHALQQRQRRRWVSAEIECVFHHLASRSPPQLKNTMRLLALQSSSSLTVTTATVVLTTATRLRWESDTPLEHALHQRIVHQARLCAPDELIGAFEALQGRFEVLDVEFVRHWHSRLQSILDDNLRKRIERVLQRAERIHGWQQCRLASAACDRLIERRLAVRGQSVDDDELCAMAWAWSKARSSSRKHALVGNLIAEHSVANPTGMETNAALASVCHALQEGGLDHDDLFSRVLIWLQQQALPTMMSKTAFRLFYSLAMTGHTTDKLQKMLIARFRSGSFSGVDYLAAGLARNDHVDVDVDVIDVAARRLRVAFESGEIARLLYALALARTSGVEDATVEAAFGRIDVEALSLPTLIVTCWSTSSLCNDDNMTPARICLRALSALKSIDVAPELLLHVHDLRLQLTSTSLPPGVSKRVDDAVEGRERALQRRCALQRNQVRELAASLCACLGDVFTAYRCGSTGFILDAFWPRQQVAFCVEAEKTSCGRALAASFLMRRRVLRRHGIKVCVASAERISELMSHDNDVWLSDLVQKAASASGECVLA